jgi:hypothetical protein
MPEFAVAGGAPVVDVTAMEGSVAVGGRGSVGSGVPLVGGAETPIRGDVTVVGGASTSVLGGPGRAISQRVDALLDHSIAAKQPLAQTTHGRRPAVVIVTRR